MLEQLTLGQALIAGVILGGLGMTILLIALLPLEDGRGRRKPGASSKPGWLRRRGWQRRRAG